MLVSSLFLVLYYYKSQGEKKKALAGKSAKRVLIKGPLSKQLTINSCEYQVHKPITPMKIL